MTNFSLYVTSATTLLPLFHFEPHILYEDETHFRELLVIHLLAHLWSHLEWINSYKRGHSRPFGETVHQRCVREYLENCIVSSKLGSQTCKLPFLALTIKTITNMNKLTFSFDSSYLALAISSNSATETELRKIKAFHFFFINFNKFVKKFVEKCILQHH